MSSSAKIRAGLCADIWLPHIVYRAWPWMVLAMAAAYGCITREPLIATGLIVYAAWIVYERFIAALAMTGDDYEL